MDQGSIFSRCPKFHELDLMEVNDKTVRIFEKGAGKWDKIATRLHFEGAKIAQIRTDCQHDTYQACQKTFTEWLDGKEGLRRPTAWSTVITALKEAGLGQLADDLEEILLLLEKDSASPQESKSPITATSSAQALLSTPAGTQQTFPMLKRTISGLNSENYEKLQTRLYSESISLTENFGRMFNNFFQSLSDREVSIKKIVANLKAFGAFSPVYMYEGGNQPLLRDELHADRLDLAIADIDDIKMIILDYCSFFNYRLLSSLVASLGSENDKRQFEKYEAKFKEYAKRRIYECPSELGKLNNTNAILTIKLDSHYEQCSLNQLKLLEADFCEILHISNLNLCLVTSGCLQLTFQLPWFLQKLVFPLSPKQEEELTALHVHRVVCKYYYFPVKKTQAATQVEQKSLHTGDKRPLVHEKERGLLSERRLAWLKEKREATERQLASFKEKREAIKRPQALLQVEEEVIEKLEWREATERQQAKQEATEIHLAMLKLKKREEVIERRLALHKDATERQLALLKEKGEAIKRPQALFQVDKEVIEKVEEGREATERQLAKLKKEEEEEAREIHQAMLKESEEVIERHLALHKDAKERQLPLGQPKKEDRDVL